MNKDGEQTEENERGGRWMRRCRIQIDVIQLMLFLVALVTHLWKLDTPNAIVFDELHYGRYAAMYLKRMFFFDSHPPLGKLLLALAGYLAGWDGGEFTFDQIGTPYASAVPVWWLRLGPAICGSLSVPLVYELLLTLQCSCVTASLAAAIFILDNALLCESRFMLIDAFLILFILTSLICLLNFKEQNKSSPFCASWWMWLILLSLSSTAAICTKYVGVMSYLLCVISISRDMWNMLPDQTLTHVCAMRHLCSRALVLLLLPLLLYTSLFYVHLSILNKAGPHDDIMTSAFQATLQGGLSSITQGQPAHVVYGSQVTLRHTYGKPCWLHSHEHVYPLRYTDGRGSSHQQQVTCYTYKDVNNWWIVKQPSRDSLLVDEPVQPVQHGDVIQLIHGITSRALNSHDVAAPMSPQYQEVSCYIDYNISSQAQNLWRVEVVNADEEGPVWKTIKSHVRLVHLNTSQHLKLSGSQLGEWGFYQYEVATDRSAAHDNTAVWNVEEHRYTRTSSQDETERDMAVNTVATETSHTLGFFSKFWELQVKMLLSWYESVTDHRYSSHPLSWPLMQTNVAYWMDEQQQGHQIQLLGNCVLWWSGSMALVVYIVLFIFYTLRRHRQCYDISEAIWSRFLLCGEVCVCGYFLHLLPYLLCDDVLFLHHYLPALVFQLILIPCVIEHCYCLIRSAVCRYVYCLFILCWLAYAAVTFWRFLPFTYGTSLNTQQIQQLEWLDAWDFIGGTH